MLHIACYDTAIPDIKATMLLKVLKVVGITIVLVFILLVEFHEKVASAMWWVVSSVIEQQMSDIPAPPEYHDKYLLYSSTWLLTYETTLSEPELAAYYIQELPKEGWTVTSYEGAYYSCIQAKDASHARVIEMMGIARTITRISIFYNELSQMCKFE